MFRVFAKYCLFVAASLAAGGAFAGAAAQPRLDPVTLQLKWRHQFQFAGYYAALEKGYYREAGLDVTLREGSPTADPTQEVLAGRAEFGVGNSDLVLFRSHGEPVVVLAVIYQHSPLALVVRAASGVTDLHGLHDKRMMMIPSEGAEIKAYFKFEGLDPAKLDIRPHTFNIEDFIAGRVDAMSAYTTDQPFTLRQRGVEYLTFLPRSGGIDFYGDCLFTTEGQIKMHPERVRAFRAASLRGWEYALAHPEEMADLIVAKYNTQNKPREAILFEAQHTINLIHPELIEVGHINLGRWRHIADTYADFGMMPRDFPLDGFLFDPNPRPDYRWLFWTLGIVSAVAAAALGWALPLWWLNRRLRQEIERQRATQAQLEHARDDAEAANAAKSRYLAVMTHEVRTPLGGIISLADLLQGDRLDSEQRLSLSLIERTAQDLLKLIDDLLEYSKVEAGRLELEKTRVELEPFLDELRRLFIGAAQDKGLRFDVGAAKDAPAAVSTDAIRLREILGNLIANAIKFTDKGGVSLEMSARREPTSAGANAPPARWRLRFAVRDSGIGITPEFAARIFNPYAQAPGAGARHRASTGLGLAISSQLAKLFDGSLTLESVPGVGSTFTLEILAEEAK